MSPRSSGLAEAERDGESRPGTSLSTPPNRRRRNPWLPFASGARISLACLISRLFSVSTRDGLRFAVGDQRVDVLDRQPRIRLIESDRSAARSRCEVNELLQVLSAWRRRRALGKPEDKIEDLSDVLGKVGDVFVERAVIDRKEADLIVLERYELREMRRADGVQVFRRPFPARAQDQLYSDEMQVRLDWQDHQKWMQFAASVDLRGGRKGLDCLGGDVGIGRVQINRTDKMRRGPFNEGVYVRGGRRGRRIRDMLEDRIKDRSRELGEIGHEVLEFAVEISKK